MKNKLIIAFFLIVSGVCLGLFIAFNIDNNVFDLQTLDGPQKHYEVRATGFNDLTSPLLECSINEQIGANEFKTLEISLNNYINTQISENKVEHVSVYFRDLNNGPWIGINEQEKFTPASLLKLPLMMAFYKISEKNPDILQEELPFEASQQAKISSVTQTITPGKTLEVNKKYRIEDLIKRMIIYSDNNAWLVLINKLNPDNFYQIFQDLGFVIDKNSDLTTDSLTVRDYSAFFRILYNSTYLSHINSEKALGILTQVKYSQGLVAKLPRNVQVAHKFGERQRPDGSKQLHDCGIVYYPSHPYLLCIMSRGDSDDNLTPVIADISYQVYQYVDSKFKQ